MSKLYISEYASSGSFSYSEMPVAQEPSLTTQAIDFSGGEVKSNAFSSQTTFIRVKADAACHFSFGSDPTATTSHAPLSAGDVEYFGVTPGSKISVIGA